MAPFTNIAFDLDGVLASLSDSVRVGRLADLTGQSPDWIYQQIWGSGFEDLSDAGGYDAETYLVEFGRRIGYPITEQEWVEVRRAGMAIYPDLLEFVTGLKAQFPLAILTNNGWQLRRSLYRILPELEPVFGPNLRVSAEFGRRKPEPQIYLDLCKSLDWDPAETLFVDDRADNVTGAITAGLYGHVFHSRRELQDLLRRLTGGSVSH